MSRRLIRVLFAPDWREGVPYQQLLGDALARCGVGVDYLRGYRRVLPFTRLTRGRPCDLLHLHWPEAYYPPKHDGWDWFRDLRFPLDIALAARHRALVMTAHNLHAHNRGAERGALRNYRAALHAARAIVAHSETAKSVLQDVHGIPLERVHVIPHGDLSVTVGSALTREAARKRLGWGDEKVCVMFGTVEPYKGIEEVLEYWRAGISGIRLVIAGKPASPEYRTAISRAAEGSRDIVLQLQRLPDDDLRCLLSAADCVLFNYRAIFTSGAACLARSYGVPILIPSRLATVDLGEPAPGVFRFRDLGDDFKLQLGRALTAGRNEAAASQWREKTAWTRIAQQTAEVYAKVLDEATSSGTGTAYKKS